MNNETVKRTHNFLREVWELARTEQYFDVAALAKKHTVSGSRLHHAIALGYFAKIGGRIVNRMMTTPTFDMARLVCQREAEAMRASALRVAQRKAGGTTFSFTPKTKPAAPVQLKLQAEPVPQMTIPSTILAAFVHHWLTVCTFEQLAAASCALTDRGLHGFIEHPVDKKQTIFS